LCYFFRTIRLIADVRLMPLIHNVSSSSTIFWCMVCCLSGNKKLSSSSLYKYANVRRSWDSMRSSVSCRASVVVLPSDMYLSYNSLYLFFAFCLGSFPKIYIAVFIIEIILESSPFKNGPITILTIFTLSLKQFSNVWAPAVLDVSLHVMDCVEQLSAIATRPPFAMVFNCSSSMWSVWTSALVCSSVPVPL